MYTPLWWTSAQELHRASSHRCCSCPGMLKQCTLNDHIWRSDEGLLTDRNALLVKAVHFGGTPLKTGFQKIRKPFCKGRGRIRTSCHMTKMLQFWEIFQS
uniref:Uncharacterized protein n=1 Tax=Paramormyrops kingsleyae TaxID=1676925 RepID=A0A3B3TAU8_9TELE